MTELDKELYLTYAEALDPDNDETGEPIFLSTDEVTAANEERFRDNYRQADQSFGNLPLKEYRARYATKPR